MANIMIADAAETQSGRGSEPLFFPDSPCTLPAFIAEYSSKWRVSVNLSEASSSNSVVVQTSVCLLTLRDADVWGWEYAFLVSTRQFGSCLEIH